MGVFARQPPLRLTRLRSALLGDDDCAAVRAPPDVAVKHDVRRGGGLMLLVRADPRRRRLRKG